MHRNVVEELVMEPKKEKRWYRNLKKFMRLFIKKTEFIYVGDKFPSGSLIMSNHEGTKAPLAWELYGDVPVRFWGNEEMNSGLKRLYRYQTKVFYHGKLHWNIHLARLFCLLAAPLTHMFYQGIKPISIRAGFNLKQTINETIECVKERKENIVIFPEDSTKGYLEVLEGFHSGFIILCERCLREGIDLPIVIGYFRKSDKKYILDEPVLYSVLKAKYQTKEELAQALCDRCNELGQMFKDK